MLALICFHYAWKKFGLCCDLIKWCLIVQPLTLVMIDGHSYGDKFKFIVREIYKHKINTYKKFHHFASDSLYIALHLCMPYFTR